MLKSRKVNGFNVIRGNFVDDIENDNETGLHLINCIIERYDEDGIHFTPGINSEAYFQSFDGSKEYIVIEK